MLKVPRIEFKDGFYKVNINMSTKFSFLAMKKSTDGVPKSLVELIGMNGFNAGSLNFKINLIKFKVDIQVMIFRGPIFLDKGHKSSMVLVTDSEYKVAFNYIYIYIFLIFRPNSNFQLML